MTGSVAHGPTDRVARRRLTLRGRLLLTLVAVTAVVSLTVGGVSVVLLQAFLVGRLDDQLAGAVARSSTGREGGFPGPGRGPRGGDFGFLLQPGQAEGTLGAEIEDGTVERVAVLDDRGRAASLETDTASALLGVDPGEGPTTVRLASLGAYRLVATTTPDGSTIVTGLPLSGVRSTTLSLLAIIVTATAAGVVVVVLLGGAVIQRAVRPLHDVTRTATRVRDVDLTSGAVVLPDRVPADVAATPDEVGEVASALNRMLDHVEAALAERHRSETQVRQFVADASHELRTPLASIQGYSELVRRRPEPLPDDVVAAMGRVESEARRMAGLVDDLLLLARLDAGRPVEREEVDLVPLAVAALSDAHAAGPDHRWVLDLDGLDPESGDADEVTVLGEEARLQQVLANLLGNARVHTPPGTTVTLRVERSGGDAVVTVADDGPGVPDGLRDSVFERFTRGDSSRSRAAGSTGLGLSIVAAVVRAHGGTVASPAQARGAAFVVSLPLARSSDETSTTDGGIGGDVHHGAQHQGP
ncbi:sensor histidine kinase [Aquipuribacter nitratireducens]|uniref:histidine kinase n=1 Tax=Aquipuribacter nitratireducens TaxID=650104 RepID=A0ABW0GI94_9MICO